MHEEKYFLEIKVKKNNSGRLSPEAAYLHQNPSELTERKSRAKPVSE